LDQFLRAQDKETAQKYSEQVRLRLRDAGWRRREAHDKEVEQIVSSKVSAFGDPLKAHHLQKLLSPRWVEEP
jgi:hypothetical protein